MVQEEGIPDAVAWLNLPLDIEGSTEFVSKAEIYVSEGVNDLLAYVKRHITLDELLTRTTARRHKADAQPQVIMAPDGHPSIVSGRRDD
jgi:hypothetical protein